MKKLFLFPILISQVLWAQTPNFFDLNSLNTNVHKDPLTFSSYKQDVLVNEDYKIGPGDQFEVLVEKRSFVLQVSPEGYVSIEMTGLIPVNDLKLKDAKEKILDALSKNYRRNLCAVQLIQTKPLNIQILGAVKNPGYFNFGQGMRVSQAVNAVGGSNVNGDLENILIIQKNGDTNRVNLVKIKRFGLFEKDIFLNTGDKIYVPFIDFDKPSIAIRTNSGIALTPFHSESVISEYLDSYGMLRDIQGVAFIRVGKKSGSVQIPIHKINEVKIEQNDTLEVLANSNTVYVGGTTRSVGAFPYNPSHRPIDYVLSAGVNPVSEGVTELHIIRFDGTKETINTITGKLYPGDFIMLDRSAFEYFKDWVPIISTITGTIATTIGAYSTYTLLKERNK